MQTPIIDTSSTSFATLDNVPVIGLASPIQAELLLAIENNDLNELRRVIHKDITVVSGQYGVFNISMLHTAVALGNTQLVEELILHNADVNIQDLMGYTPLHFASRNNYLDIVKLLLSTGADINAKGRADKCSCLHIAAGQSLHVVVKHLLSSHTADVHALDYKKNTPLHFACTYGAGDHLLEVVHDLVSYKADVNAVNEQGNTPIHMIVVNNNINKNAKLDLLQFFSQCNGDFRLQNKEGKSAIDLAEQIDYKLF